MDTLKKLVGLTYDGGEEGAGEKEQSGDDSADAEDGECERGVLDSEEKLFLGR